MPKPEEMRAYIGDAQRPALEHEKPVSWELLKYSTMFFDAIKSTFPHLLEEVDGVVVLATGGTGDRSRVKAGAARAVFYGARIFRFSHTMPDPEVPNGLADRVAIALYGNDEMNVAVATAYRGPTESIEGEVLGTDLTEVLEKWGIKTPLLLITGNIVTTLFQITRRGENGLEAFKQWVDNQPLEYVLFDCSYGKGQDNKELGQEQTRLLEGILPEGWWFHALNEHMFLMSRDSELFPAAGDL